MVKDATYTNGVIAVKEKYLLKDKIFKMCEGGAEEALRALTDSGFNILPISAPDAPPSFENASAASFTAPPRILSRPSYLPSSIHCKICETEAERLCENYEIQYFSAKKYDLIKNQPFLYYVFRRRAENANVGIGLFVKAF